MPAIKKICLAVIVVMLAIPALAGLAIQFNDPLPSIFYSRSMGQQKWAPLCALLPWRPSGRIHLQLLQSLLTKRRNRPGE